MSSTRLPGKVLTDIGSGETMLALMLKRLERARSLERIVVATSDHPSDDAIAASKGSVPVYRGPLHDVLARYVGAIGDWDGVVVRVTADCPLIDPEIVDQVVALMEPGIAYASNVDPRSYPKGLDTEVFRPEALRELAAESTDPAEREHVTLGLRARPERWPAASLVNNKDLGDLRWTVDTPEDLEHVRAIVRALGDRRYEASMDEVLAVTPSPT
jgi:spore coat polysaccharide biosynthesis protein SpsF (cytidylyltransferase family)